MAGSSVVALDEELPPLAEPELGAALLLLEALGCSAFCSLGAALELELELDGAALEPPEAGADFDVSVEEELEALGALGGVTPMEVLDEEEPGVAGALVPPEAELDEEPGAVDGDDGVAVSLRAVLELEEPGADDVRSGPLLQAARPKANATARVRIESFMCPPWLGYETKQQNARPS